MRFWRPQLWYLSPLLTALVVVCGFAQQERVVRVGVVELENTSTRGVPTQWETDRLALYLTQQKPDKKLHLRVQGVVLKSTDPGDVTREAQERGCDYVVYTTLRELRSADDPYVRRPGTFETNPNGTWGNRDPSAQRVDPEFRATVEYRLLKVGDPSPISGAPFSTQQASTEQDVVAQVLDRIAARVSAEIKKGGSPMRE